MLSSKKLTVLTFILLACYCGLAQNRKDTVIILKHPGAMTVNGEVTDAATGKPLSGISVSFKDYSAAISDSLGKFSLKLPSKNVALIFEGEGYQTKEVSVGGKDHIMAAL